MDNRVILLVFVAIAAGFLMYHPSITGEVIAGRYSGDVGQVKTAGNVQIVDPTGIIHEIAMTAQKFKFTPDTITVGVGDTVRLTVRSVDNNIGLAIPGYGIRIPIEWNQYQIIEFVANKRGTFEYTPWPPRDGNFKLMRGYLIVN